MKNSLLVVLCVVFILGLMSACFADSTALEDKSELMAAGAWIDTSEDLSGLVLGVGYGKFIDPNLEIKLDLLYGNVDFDGEDIDALVLAPAAVYNFVPETPSATVPYLGLGGAYARVSGDGESEDSLKLQYFAGAKFFIGGDYETANKALFLEYRHTGIEFFGEEVDLDMVWGGLTCIF